MRTFLSVLLVLTIPATAVGQAVNPNDVDGDGLLNTEEDQNGDGIVNTGETDWKDADTDGGGEADGAEIQAGRDPLDRRDDLTYDLDGDGLANGQEANRGTDPSNPDTDGDGISDADDPFPLDAEYTKDTDGDGLPDEYETQHNLSPEIRSDAKNDDDSDGVTNVQEFQLGTVINNTDSDKDGIEDGKEVERGSDPLENPCLELATPTEVLHDVDEHWSKEYVLALQQTKIMPSSIRIVQGYATNDGYLFRPDRPISRFEFLKIALLSSCITPANIAEGPTFFDVRRQGRPFEREDAVLKRQIIYTAYDRGIIDGYPDNNFRPDDPITRAEAIKILMKTAELEPFDNDDYSGLFPDVDDTAWYAPFVKTAISYGFIEGYEDGTLQPASNITRAEASKLVLLVMVSNPHVNGYVIPTENITL